jgi:cathepsin L
MRKGIFESNLNKILAHNADNTKTWKEAINHLADWTAEEMRSLYGYNKALGFSRKEAAVKATASNIKVSSPADLPESVDWRQQFVVTAVKDQGDCGSCWSFATAETIESHWALATGDLWTLSEQQILDCTINPQHCGGTGGCEGGTVEVAMDTIIKVGGLSSEWTYPYLSHAGNDQPQCLFNTTTTPPAVNISSYVSLPSNQYEPLISAVATNGPIAISVDASTWSFYSTGVYNGCNQTNPDLDHAVQLVGYGSENGLDYWLVRNSWTPAWGENGYIKIFRTANNTCGTDLSPGDGDGCDGGPSSVEVCGTCGILYDSVYPVITL